MPIPCKSVCNPAAVFFGGEFLLLLRVIDQDDRSHLFVARSADGVGNWRVEKEPLLTPDRDSQWFDNLGCEDPRITPMEESGEYAITYVGYSRLGACVCMAITSDFATVTKLGVIIHPYNKDAALLPRKSDGHYRLLHRPTAGPLENIWMSSSPDLLHWGHPVCVLEESDKPGWDDGKVGAGPPPIETPHGLLLIFHGVESIDNGWIYRMGMVLLDKNNPENVIVRWPYWLMEPCEPYEFSSANRAIIFPTGAILRDNLMYVYYGAGDTVVGLATVEPSAIKEFEDELDRASLARTS
jgi:beta-1,4-mannooligosaccharide/beta-1,4-mannosyl-N-acetylglucosamine phosphorylase